MSTLFRFRNLMLLLVLCAVPFVMPATSNAQISVGVAIHLGPPALPVYTQPPCPVEGYLWTPGYWAYGPAGYYWVPGVWVAPPHPGLLWTPGYWGFVGGAYGWHAGYWGPHVGFYGGINYGFGYGGVGFVGGRWDGGVFRYNTAVVNVNRTIVRNVYVDRTVVVNNYAGHASFNGEGGVNARPTAEEQRWSNEQHFQPTSNQMQHEENFRNDHNALASVNHGEPHTVAMNRVNGRQFDQQGRIAQGVHSGQLTPGETQHLENREANIHNEVHNDREANGGHLTQQERQQVNRQQNQASRDIYRDKHNNKTDAHPHPEREEHHDH
ncbi:MAG TPA: YXWGXW repeat-containing protein [Candidatus Baltobacteraceae bacterium]|nr:YXWGXW repeat-containing protein [Candidatus Baltobacteraceae bacterium]